MAVYQSCHVVKLGFPKKEHIPASGAKRIDTTEHVGNFRRCFIRLERCHCEAKKNRRETIWFHPAPSEAPELPQSTIANERASELDRCAQNIPAQAPRLSCGA